MNYVRNISAHHARLFNRKLVIAAKRPRDVPLLEHLVDARDAKTTFGVYGTLAVMAYLLRVIGQADRWCQELTELLERFPVAPGIDATSMGITAGWRAERLWVEVDRS